MPDPVVEFDKVNYRIAGKPILEDLTLKLDAGQTTAFLGRSGSGKTTSLKLINRLIDPSAGRITWDG